MVSAWYTPYRLTKEQKGYSYENGNCLEKSIKSVKTMTNLEYQNTPTVDGTWIYTCEPLRRVNNKQLLCKDQARPVIVKEQTVRGKFHMPYI